MQEKNKRFEKNRGWISIYIDEEHYLLSLYQAKELYYLLRDLIDPNFKPSKSDAEIKAFLHNKKPHK